MEQIVKTKELKMIVAVNQLGYIGLMGGIPWRCSDDLKHFKANTINCKCILGRKTFEGLPPLKNRELIIIGKEHNSIDQALEKVGDSGWVIGGNQIYEQMLPYCKEIHVSLINDYSVGDTRFLENITDDWKLCLNTWLWEGDRSLHIYNFEPNPKIEM